MEWIEIIRLRTQPDIEKSVLGWLKELVQNIRNTPGINEAKIYSHVAVPGDLSLHLKWDTFSETFTESEIGLTIAEALHKYGMLDHTVWLMKGNNGSGVQC